jgi:hypothetical protein
MHDKPYETPSSVADAGDESRRPVGVAILSVLTGIIGLALLGALVVLVANWRENNEFCATQRIATSVFWLFSSSTAVIPLAASSVHAAGDAGSFTIQGCMRTVTPIAETTACLSLSLMWDEGHIGFCESDFAVHPAGVLLRYVTGKRVFMYNPTFPHNGLVTCAHCACPSRMDGTRYEPIEIPTHYKSDFGAATKVKMPIGQEVTLIDPDCA